MTVTGPSSAIVTACETPFQLASDRAVSLKEPLSSYTTFVQFPSGTFLTALLDKLDEIVLGTVV